MSTKSAKEQKKDKKRQPLKDENGNDVKRPLSAYMLYNNYRRPVLRAEHSGRLNPFIPHLCLSIELTLTDLSKLIGEEWKKLNEL